MRWQTPRRRLMSTIRAVVIAVARQSEPQFTAPPAPSAGECPVCEDYGFVGTSWTFGRVWKCTCGAGPVDNELILHAADCGGVLPCPFCELAKELTA